MVLKLWSMVVGQSVFVLRVLSLFWGLLAIALVYRMAKLYFSTRIAWYAALVMGMNAFYIHFTHEMRTYTQMVALVLVLMFLYECRRRTTQHRLINDLMFALTTAALVYTHYFNVFPIAVMFFYYGITYRKQVQPARLVVAHLVAAITFLPWLNVLLGGLLVATTDYRQVGNLTLIGGISEILRFFGNGNLAIILLTLAVVRASPSTRRTGNAIWILLIAMYGVTWLATRFFPIFTEIRYVLYVWPFLAMLAALGIDQLDQRGIPNVLILGVWGLTFVGSLLSATEQWRIHPWPTPPFPDLEATVRGHLQPDDALMWVTPPLTQYVVDDMLQYYLYPYNGDDSHIIKDSYATTDEHYAAQVAAAAGDRAFVWVAYETANWTWRLGEIEKQLENDLDMSFCGTLPQPNRTHVDLFARPQFSEGSYIFDVGGNQPVTVEVLRDSYLADGAIYTVLGWQRPPDSNSLSLGIHVEDPQQNFLAGADTGMSGDTYECGVFRVETDIFDVNDIVMRLVVYDWQTGERFYTRQGDMSIERPVIGNLTILVD
jgi:hypothetical protein